MMKTTNGARLAIAISLCAATILLACPSRAAVTLSGDDLPLSAADWNASTDGYIGNTGSGTLSVTPNSHLFSSYGRIGNGGAASGSATVSGSGASWTLSRGLYVGEYGSGTLNIIGGGTVSGPNYNTGYAALIGDRAGSTGAVHVSGAGSTFNGYYNLYVGNLGAGTLNVTAGGYCSCTNAYIGNNTASTGAGTVTISGVNSRFIDGGSLGVGLYGGGTLNVNSGGHAQCTGAFIGGTATAEVNVSGSGSVWTNGMDNYRYFYVGYSAGTGSLNITDGGTVQNSSICAAIGYAAGSTGIVNVSGPGSTWTNPNLNSSTLGLFGNGLFIGVQGGGTLSIANAGSVSAGGATYLAYKPGSSGLINFGPGGGTLTTQTLFASPSQLTGAGAIIALGMVCDNDLVFDAAHPAHQTTAIAGPTGQSVAIDLDLSGPIGGVLGDLGAGYRACGSLTVKNGRSVNSNRGYIGYAAGSNGLATVSGSGSSWNAASDIHVGYNGSGTLSILAGGTVSTAGVIPGVLIGSQAGSSGTVNVSGPGSMLNCGYVVAGSYGSGTLKIAGGGVVSDYDGEIAARAASSVTVSGAGSAWNNASTLRIDNNFGTLNVAGGGVVSTRAYFNNSGRLAIDVGRESQFRVTDPGSGITNYGTIRVLAGAGVAGGASFMPIVAPAWNNYGIYQPLGGTWNAPDRIFIASNVQVGTSGTPVVSDLNTTQRFMIHDSATNWNLGASFAASTSLQPLNFTATAIDPGTLAPGQTVLGAWTLSAAAGYTAGDPLYLSFGLGAGYSEDKLQLWRCDGASWTKFSADDLTYDGNYASFTASGMAGYACSVPEPSTLALLVSCLVGLSARAMRKRRR
jgi:fibronectin-binding autotransporter adhesin